MALQKMQGKHRHGGTSLKTRCLKATLSFSSPLNYLNISIQKTVEISSRKLETAFQNNPT